MICCPPKTIGKLLVSFIWCLMAPLITQSKDNDDTIWQDALMKALRRAKWTQNFNTKINLCKVLRQFFGRQMILPPFTKLQPEPEKFQRREPNLNLSFIYLFPLFPLFVYRVSISGKCDGGIMPWCHQGLDKVFVSQAYAPIFLYLGYNIKLPHSGIHSVASLMSGFLSLDTQRVVHVVTCI